MIPGGKCKSRHCRTSKCYQGGLVFLTLSSRWVTICILRPHSPPMACSRPGTHFPLQVASCLRREGKREGGREHMKPATFLPTSCQHTTHPGKWPPARWGAGAVGWCARRWEAMAWRLASGRGRAVPPRERNCTLQSPEQPRPSGNKEANTASRPVNRVCRWEPGKRAPSCRTREAAALCRCPCGEPVELERALSSPAGLNPLCEALTFNKSNELLENLQMVEPSWRVL